MKNMFIALALATILAKGAAAQQDGMVYIQIESQSSLAGAMRSLQDLSTELDNVNGFALGGDWYGIALGPYNADEAQSWLSDLIATGRIPRDSYIEEANSYGQQFWPVGAQAQARAEETQDPAPLPDETSAQARASERDLTRTERDALQIALKWAGYYTARIDGSFGGGTRRAMAAWQQANGHDASGILTTRQRAQLLAQYNAVLDGMDLGLIRDARAGIEIELPQGAVAFSRHEAPFAIWEGTGSVPDAKVLLISQPGDRTALRGFYEIMQTLRIVPVEGERSRKADRFTLTGANDRIVSHSEVSLQNGEIKGFTLVWPAGDEERRARILTRMQQSFTRIPGLLDPAMVSDEAQGADLLAGLELRVPRLSASGFFVDQGGTVLTAQSTVAECERITLDGRYDAKVLASDAALGLAALTPRDAIAPRAVAGFDTTSTRAGEEIAVAGYSFGGALSAPSLTFGEFATKGGLGGEAHLDRLTVTSLPGDAGGPVLRSSGALLGMLLARNEGTSRRLPEDVGFALSGEMVMTWLNSNGIRPQKGGGREVLDPVDMSALAADMTVLVSCWE